MWIGRLRMLIERMFCASLIFCVISSNMVLIDARTSFLTEPKLDPYLVKPGDQNVILPCSISDDYVKTSGSSLQWLRINAAGPRLLTLGSTTKVNSGYELDTINCSSRSSNDAQQQIGCYNLRIKHVSYEQDNGNFFCQVDKSDGSVEQSNPAKVIVIVPPGPPNITAQPVGPVRENDFVEIECQTKNGNPPPNISWFFTNGSEIVSVSVKQENASHVQEATKSWIKFFVTPSENGAVVLCRVNNDATSSTNEKVPDAAAAPLNVIYSPRVTVSPSSPYNTEIGGQAFFTCSADSNPPPTKMEWTLNDEVLAGSDGRQTLNFTVTKTTFAGIYACLVTSQAGQGQARTRLSIFYAPEVKLNDEYRGAVGKPITIFCSVDASPPATKILWTGPNGFSSDGSSLDIKALTLKDMGNYTCQASNEMVLYGQGNVTRTGSKSTTLMVDHAPGKAIIRPAVEPVVVGSDANLTCAADDPGSPLASYRWKRPSQQNFTFSSDGRPYLIIEGAKLADSGEYACQPYNEIGMGEIGIYYLTVYVPAQIEQGPKQTEAKTENDTGFFLTCTASGHPAPNITWFRDGVAISSIATADNHWESSISADDTNKCENNVTCLSKVAGRLEWKSGIRWSDKGLYECQAYNGAGPSPARASSVLSISHRPVILNNPSRSFVAADIKDAATITCRSTARPEPKFRWSKDNNELVSDDLHSIIVKRLNKADDVYESSLMIKNVRDQEMGEYVCIAANQLGQADFKFTLQPKSKPTSVSNIRVVENAFTSMIVGWTPGFDGGSQQVFVVELTQTADGKIRIYNATSYHNAQSAAVPQSSSSLDDIRRIKRSVAVEQVEDVLYNITGLLPGSEYKIRVKSVNSLGETEFSPSLPSSTMDAPLDASLPKATEAVYNSDSMTIKFKPTNIDQASHCLLLYRQMTSGKFSAENCFPPDTGLLEHVRPANNFKVRFCSKDTMVCGPEVDVLTGAESPLSWPIIVAVVVCLLALIMVCLGVLIYCFRSRRSAVTKKASPQMSASSSIVGGRVVNQQANPHYEENDLSAANRRTPSLNDNIADSEMNGKRHASKDSGLYTPTNGTLPGAPITSSSNPYDLQRYSSEPMDLTPKKDTNYEGPTVKNGQHSNRPLNRGPSYEDHHEHWGATDGYGLNNNGAGGANPHHHQSNGAKIAAVATPMVNMSPNGAGGDPSRQYSNQNDGNSINSDYSNPRRVMKEIIV